MNNPNDKATNPQTFAIFCLSKHDVRNCNLTKAQAGALIDKLKKDLQAGLAEVSQLPGTIRKGEAKPKQDWQSLYNEAHEAGMKAGEGITPEPMVVNTHSSPPVFGNTPIVARSIVNDGVCGFAWVAIRPANSSFALWLKKNNLGRSGSYGGIHVWVHQFNQSYTRKSAYAAAFAGVLQKAGIKAYPDSRID